MSERLFLLVLYLFFLTVKQRLLFITAFLILRVKGMSAVSLVFETLKETLPVAIKRFKT